MPIKFIIIAMAILISMPTVSAHPGNTAADGCHYCRTNCDKWGEVWNERHCHNAKPIPQKVTTPASTSTTKKVTPVKIDECSAVGLLKVYKQRKANGEKMNNLSSKTWWKKCPEKIRKEVFKKI